MQTIVIIDFGSQVTQLIARRVRECGVYSEILPYNADMGRIRALAPRGVILSGGPSSVDAEGAPRCDEAVFDMGIPVMGICYGMQLMARHFGGKVSPSGTREFGRTEVLAGVSTPLTRDVWQEGERYVVWMSHGDHVDELPPGFEVIASTGDTPHAAIADTARGLYGMQFHPEVAHTPGGGRMIEHFARDICGCAGDWNMHSFLEHEVEQIRAQVGSAHVIAAVSGGVDSSVVSTLIHRAIGQQLSCIFIDTGLLRKNEAAQVRDMFATHHVPLLQLDRSELFLSRLDEEDDPEKKRKIIGATFIEVFEQEARKLEAKLGVKAEYLAQGTLYPDVIESVSVHGDASVTIKSHHNVGGLPEKMDMKLLEPVRELFKDEVRKLGLELGLPEEMVRRHPFPGPGLAIRIPGAISCEKIAILQEADDIYIRAIRKHGLYDEIWQAFAVLLPVRSVGVMGDGRTYEYVCALRAVTSTDGMTADTYPFTHEFLSYVSNKIVNNVRGINRVVYDITSKPPGTIEWE